MFVLPRKITFTYEPNVDVDKTMKLLVPYLNTFGKVRYVNNLSTDEKGYTSVDIGFQPDNRQRLHDLETILFDPDMQNELVVYSV